MAIEVFIRAISCLSTLTQKGEILLLRKYFSLNKVSGQTCWPSQHPSLTHRFVMVTRPQHDSGRMTSPPMGRFPVGSSILVLLEQTLCVFLLPPVRGTDTSVTANHGHGPALTAHRAPRRSPHSPSGQAPRQGTGKRIREKNIGRWALAPRRARSRCSPSRAAPAAAPFAARDAAGCEPPAPHEALAGPAPWAPPLARAHSANRRGREGGEWKREAPYPDTVQPQHLPQQPHALPALPALPTSAPPRTARGAPGH